MSMRKTSYKPRRRRMDIDQPNTADVPNIEVGVATNKEHMVLRVFGEGGCCRPAEWEKKLVQAPSRPPKFMFLAVHICQIA